MNTGMFSQILKEISSDNKYCIHLFFSREEWRYVDWTITSPLQKIEFATFFFMLQDISLCRTSQSHCR